LRVDQEARGAGKAGADICRFQVRIVRKNLIRALPRGSPCGSRIREIYPERSSAQVFIGGGAAGEDVEDVFDARQGKGASQLRRPW
jgi:hypothetical protein